MSLALQLGSVLVILVVTVPAYWILSRLVLRTAAPTVWLRRLLILLIPLAGGVYLLLSLLALGEPASDIVTALLSGVLPRSALLFFADLAAQFVLFSVTAAVTLTTYAVITPAIRHARELDVSTWRLLRRTGRFVALLTVFMTVFVVPFERVVSGDDGVLAPVTLMLFILLLTVPFLTPVTIRVVRHTRPPERSERSRLEAASERAGLRAERFEVLSDAEETLEMYIRGLRSRRRVFVSEFALTGFDDETLSALLAVNAGSVKHQYGAIKHSPLFGFLVAAVAALAWGSPPAYAIMIIVALVLPLPVLWLARRAVRRADDYAAARVGHQTVADALEQMAAEQNLDIPSGGRTTVFKSRPPLQDRIDRLRDSTD